MLIPCASRALSISRSRVLMLEAPDARALHELIEEVQIDTDDAIVGDVVNALAADDAHGLAASQPVDQPLLLRGRSSRSDGVRIGKPVNAPRR